MVEDTEPLTNQEAADTALPMLVLFIMLQLVVIASLSVVVISNFCD